MSTRKDVLGFEPQKESIYNQLLPYSEKIDAETTEFLAQIKGNLGRAVQLRDVKYGASHWIGQLSRYIRLFGYNFTKSDHICLVHLVFDLMTIPNLELSLVQKYAGLLTTLLKKKELLTREDLVLPWRPLYDLVESVMYSQYEHHGLQLFPSNIENVLKSVVRYCRVYFSLESTAEMLEEWRPLICPFDVTVIKALNYLELFLPTSLPPEHYDKGYKLWFDELVQLWLSFHNGPSWEYSLVSLFSRLTQDNIGYIDWTPNIDQIFTRFLRSFNLPVGSQQVPNKANNCYDINQTVQWIVSLLGGKNSVQQHVTKLFKALQSFYYPSNVGRWNVKLSGLLMAFPKHFIRRLHRERYQKPSWETPIPEAVHLTEDDITEFVTCMKNVTFVAMFGKHGSQDAAVALRHLATMRPEMTVPPLLETMYPALETLIEPHRLIACMNCIVAVARPMLRAGKWYPQGPTHLLPLLNLSLPGIDPNDFKKCLVTFQMISTFVSLVPIVDCSAAIHVRTDLTEEEREVCMATAQFEDWVLQYLDRVFTLVENSAQESTCGAQDRLNPEQSMLEVGMASTTTSVLQQCSGPIFDSAVRRLHRFLTGNVYETKVSGRFAANLCRSAAKVHPAKTLKLFLPHFCSRIVTYCKEHGDVQKEEHLDDSFLWNLQMLTQLVRCNGKELLQYKDSLEEVLSLTLTLQCVQGYEMAGMLLRYLLRALVLTYPQEYRSTSHSFDRPLEEYLPIRDWAVPGDIHNLDIEWHIPNQAEMDFAGEILSKFLAPELKLIKNIKDDTQAPTREDLLRRLNMILESILGSASLLPMWEGKAVPVMDTDVPMNRFKCSSHVVGELKLDGENVRSCVADTMRHLLSYMHASCEDDTKGFVKVMRIFETVLFFYGTQKNDFDGRWKSFHIVKAALEDKLRGKKRHIRALLVDRVQLQHELLMLNSKEKVFTSRHQDIWNDLMQLCLSRYSEVRKKAQNCLLAAFTNFPYTYRTVIKEIVHNIREPDVPEHKFKGSLYTILGNGKKSLATKRNWEILSQIWPALVQAQHSEKPSILKAIDDIVTKVVKCLETIAINVETPLKCIDRGRDLLQTSLPTPACDPATEAELQKSAQKEADRNQANDRDYVKLITTLAAQVESGKLTWKFSQISMELMAILLRHDREAPPEVVACFVKHLCHDALYIRKLAMSAVSAVLKQQKRKHPKVPVDPYKRSGCTPPPQGSSCVPGDRPDNMWHQYNLTDLPVTREKWDKAEFVDKTHWGYYSWPKEMLVYAPYDKQPKPELSRSEMNEAAQCIYDSFSSKEFVEKLISFLSLEELKGRDKFRTKYLVLFKGLFRNYGDTFLPNFQPHIERLMGDLSHDKHDSSQRCAMEILAGIIRGSKHWAFEKVERLWTWACPLLATSLSNITIETVDDWGSFYTSLSESRDPRKLHWLLTMLMENPLRGEGGAFGDASRLYAVQNALIDQEWRVPQLLHQLLEYLKPHLAHPYKNVRDRIGSVLSNVFLYDYKICPQSGVRSPHRHTFLEEILPQLQQLKDIMTEQPGNNGPKVESTASAVVASSSITKPEPMELEDNGTEDDDRKKAIRLCKTVMKWLQNNHTRAFYSSHADVFPLLPIICTLESESTDDDLKTDCATALMCLAQSLIQPDHIQVALTTVREVAGLQSWHARAAILRYIQAVVFGNMFLMDRPEHKQCIHDILLHLICDEQLEVREMASVTLSGLLHCGYMEMEEDFIGHFERLSRTKLKKRKKTSESVSMESLIQRHAGVLGLGACVQAFPYQVPEFIPRVLMELSPHVNDPQPIQMSVKKILSNFRRTHHDNWHDHKLKFTDDQLVILTDLLVSPNYYA
ncbi:proteasome activator complex subunit 4-like [Haliotis asinina]|uniref:proteasome activator complex subunit 4-like n=1 Tax=Haliotis asinina TaxID=109174 RepID=UPI00353279E4